MSSENQSPYGFNKRAVIAFAIVFPIAMLLALGVNYIGIHADHRKFAYYSIIAVTGLIYVFLAVKPRRRP